jgi:Flp pilus assembly protein TadG
VTFRIRRKLRVLRRHLRMGATRGAAGIEFAFLAPVFFTLLLGIMETGILFYAQNTLQFATQTAGRLVRTGSAQITVPSTATRCAGGAGGSGTAGAYATSQEWFKDQICCGVSALMTNCSASLHINVQNYSGGFGNTFTNSTDAGGNLQPVADNYSPGNPCDVVLLRATYNWPVVTPVLSWFLVNMAGGQHLLSATTAFRNEPFTSGSAC